jgi:hypothetical protein
MTDKEADDYSDPNHLLALNKADLDEFSRLATVSGLRGTALRRALVTTHGSQMPPNWRSMYELTTLDDTNFLNE